jgi:hypothetical protein
MYFFLSIGFGHANADERTPALTSNPATAASTATTFGRLGPIRHTVHKCQQPTKAFEANAVSHSAIFILTWNYEDSRD